MTYKPVKKKMTNKKIVPSFMAENSDGIFQILLLEKQSFMVV